MGGWEGETWVYLQDEDAASLPNAAPNERQDKVMRKARSQWRAPPPAPSHKSVPPRVKRAGSFLGAIVVRGAESLEPAFSPTDAP